MVKRAGAAKLQGVCLMGAGGFEGMKDMIDGGGAGMSGPNFEGAPISDILNQLGIKPHGFDQRQQAIGQVRPQMRPQMPQQAPQGAPSPAPVQMSQLTPQMQYDQMLEEQRKPRPQMHPQMPQGPQMPQFGGPQGAAGQPVGPQGPQYSPMMQYYQMLEMQRRQQGLI